VINLNKIVKEKIKKPKNPSLDNFKEIVGSLFLKKLFDNK